ncbi:oxygenase MpaB family protein [Nocardiopsis sp. CNT312]|uniref:oxygenase MpaB family protein n=1 Tax=Nocardiopsis sp. CNT312 TaxID=1137268 RepID=UPI0005666196|nr:oxygenase MpaB family protein [Nocardiopsis sp. CNT312]
MLRVHSEASLFIGSAYAVLLQIAHPGVARGVYDHSDFASRPLHRLRGTLYYVYGTSFGTDEERARVQAIVRALHRKVRGPGYDALDPELLLWVAATLFHTWTRMYELTVRRLEPDEAAALLTEASVYATALGLPAQDWPATPEGFDAYWRRAVTRLEVGGPALEISRQLFRPHNRLLWPLTRAQRFLAGGFLPPDLREAFRIPWSARHQRWFDRLMRAVRALYPHLPNALRTLPGRLYLRSMRRNGGWTRPPRRRRAVT